MASQRVEELLAACAKELWRFLAPEDGSAAQAVERWTSRQFAQRTGLRATRAAGLGIPCHHPGGRRSRSEFLVVPRHERASGSAPCGRCPRLPCSASVQMWGLEKGKRCRNLAGVTGLCWRHRGLLGVEVRESGMGPGSGRGLFATRDLPAGPLCRLVGLLAENEHEAGMQGNLFHEGDGEVRAAVSETSCAARFANSDPRRKGKGRGGSRNNAVFEHPHRGEGTWLVLTREVRRGEEILVSYGY